LQSLGIIVRREDFSGARTALSACFRRIGAFARTKLSALLWLRLRRAVSLRQKLPEIICRISASGGDMLLKMTSDLDLLRRFARGNSQDAFAEIVRRHLNLVYTAALRQVRSPQLAEEIAQSVFADLARGAGKISGTGVPPVSCLTPWLYAVTRRTAIEAIRKESRRQLREQIAVEMNTMNATANDWTQIEPLLDDAMAALDDTDRSAILLRYFENKNLREVGEALGASEDAAQKRVSCAVERLREFFSKRNVTIGASGLAVLISANAVQSAPIGLAATISAAAVLAGTAVHTSTVIAATKAIAMTTLQKTLITATVAVLAGAGIYEARQASQLRDQVQTLQQQQAPLAEQIQQLQREHDDATNRLADLAVENSRLKSNPNEFELLRLRGEVGVLKRQLESQRSALPTSQNTAAVYDSSNADIPDQLVDAIAHGDSLGLAKLGDYTKSQTDYFRTNSIGLQGDEHTAVWEKSFRGIASAFDRLSDEATKGNANARQAIMQATRMNTLRGFAVDSLGKLAGSGDEGALEMLLNPAQNGLLLSGTIAALQPAADAGNQRAIETLASILGDEKKKSLWLIASQGLQKAAASGNMTAINVLNSLQPQQQ
jgi:RNA polymerase sigma factor (sigma-70 family)